MEKKGFNISNNNMEYDKYFKVESATITETLNGAFKAAYKRYRLVRPDAAGILLYNKDTEKVILVKQFRFPISEKSNEFVLEIVAGKIDKGETPEQAAVRELAEEVGYTVSEDRLGKSVEFFASPGYSSEKLFVFMVIVGNEDKTGTGGGVATENESLEIVEVSKDDFKNMVLNGEIQDSKTLIASNFLFHRV
jgi:nudix-type nucleoside diphosphatase (YffH/AdpP family)